MFRSTQELKDCHLKDSKCDDCCEDSFQYYCEDCKMYLCTDCNNSLHMKGVKAQHNRFGADNRKPQSLQQTDDESNPCQEHPSEKVLWFCEDCNTSICNACIDRDGTHSKHGFISCSKKANNLLTAAQDVLRNAETRIPLTYKALNKLETLQFDLGPEGVLTFEKANTSGVKHVTSREAAIMVLVQHFETIEKYIRIQKQQKLNELEEFVKAKSQAWLSHIESLHMNLIHLDDCASEVESLTMKSSIKICVESPLLVQRIKQIEAAWSDVNITDESSISVAVCTSDVLRVLEKSCYVGGPSTPGEVLIKVADNQSSFGVSWNISEVDEGKPEVSSYVVEVKIVHEGNSETEDTPHKYTVMASISSSPESDSNRLRLEINDKQFEGQKIYAMVTATDVNGACSGKGVSANVVLPDRFVPLTVSLRYASDFDQNGLLYYVGSAGGTRGYVNPHVSGDVVVTCSSIDHDYLVQNFVNNDFNNQCSQTQNIPGSWMMVDLGATRKISPNYYSLRHDISNSHCLRNWMLEGKMNDSDTSAWVVLREHVNDASINQPAAFGGNSFATSRKILNRKFTGSRRSCSFAQTFSTSNTTLGGVSSEGESGLTASFQVLPVNTTSPSPFAFSGFNASMLSPPPLASPSFAASPFGQQMPLATNAGINQSFRYIRIRMTGVNSSGNHHLSCSGIELYGDLHINS